MEEAQRFAALGNGLRLDVFRLVIAAGDQGIPAGQIASRLDVPASTLSSHRKILQQVGLLTFQREQQKLIYRVNQEAVRELVDFLVRDCCQGQPDLCGVTIGGR
jgi:DNA-binding transcriptional ArsR family regulator